MRLWAYPHCLTFALSFIRRSGFDEHHSAGKSIARKMLANKRKLGVDAILGIVFVFTFVSVAFGQAPDGTQNGKRILRDPVELRRDRDYAVIAYQASELLKAGKLDEAQTKFEALPKAYEQGWSAYLRAREGMAEIYTRRGNWEKAIQQYERRFNPLNQGVSSTEPELHCKYVLVLCNADQLGKARENYDIALGALHKMVDRAGGLQPYLPLPPKADTFKTRPELTPVMTHLLLAAYQLTNGDKKKVESEAALGSEQDSENRLAHLYTGLALADLGRDRREQAQRELETATAGNADPEIKQAAVKTLERLVKAKSPA